MHYTMKESDNKDKAEGTHGAGALQQKLLDSRYDCYLRRD